MPIYEYRCENGHEFEVLQSMSDDPVESCEECGAPVERVYRPVAVHYKGSGFYTTDYAAKGKGKPSGGDSDSKSDSDAGSKSKDSGKSDSGKSDSGTSDSGSSGSSDKAASTSSDA